MAALRDELERRPNGVSARFAATRGTGSVALSGLHLARFCLAMAAARSRGRLDLVHINLASCGSTYRKLVVARWARALGVPYVIHLHGSEFRAFWSGAGPRVDRAIHELFRRAGRVVVLGSVWRDFVAERVPDARARITIVPNAVENPRVPHKGGGESVHILFMGRIGERKGVPDLVRALARMRDVPGWRATIAGDGPVEALREKLAGLGLAERVSVPGWLGADDAASLLATGDILTLPSYAENLPMSVIEAMASGLGVVATPVGAVEDIVKEGETGFLVAPGDDEALARALTRLVGDPELRYRVGAAAQAYQREHLSIQPYAARMVSVWREAVAEHRTPKG